MLQTVVSKHLIKICHNAIMPCRYNKSEGNVTPVVIFMVILSSLRKIRTLHKFPVYKSSRS